MDKIQPILTAIKRHYFWVLVAVVPLATVGMWWTAKADLVEQFEKGKSSYQQKIQLVKGIQSTDQHPNEKVIAAILTKNTELAEQVLAIWQKLYDRQRAEVLRWPKDAPPAFKEQVEDKEFGSQIDVRQREYYRDYVKGFLGGLPEIVQAQKYDPNAPNGARRRGGFGEEGGISRRRPGARTTGEDEAEEEEHWVVWWEDLSRLYEKYDWDDTPSDYKVWVTQEDLWVYENLLRAIANTNEGATGQHNAAIRVIQLIEVGPDAAEGVDTTGRVLFEAPATGGGPEGEQGSTRMKMGPVGPRGGNLESDDMGMRRRPGMGNRGLSSALTPEAEKAFLENYRYLDAAGQPIPVAGAGMDPENGGGSPVGPPADAPKEYKRLPIHMALEMDVGKLDRLLVECANADLPIEVTQVRINPDQTGRGGMGGRLGRSTRRPTGGMFAGGEGGYGRRTDTETATINPAIANVEIQGRVSIYKRPDRAALGLPEDLKNNAPEVADAQGAAPPGQ